MTEEGVGSSAKAMVYDFSTLMCYANAIEKDQKDKLVEFKTTLKKKSKVVEERQLLHQLILEKTKTFEDKIKSGIQSQNLQSQNPSQLSNASSVPHSFSTSTHKSQTIFLRSLSKP